MFVVESNGSETLIDRVGGRPLFPSFVFLRENSIKYKKGIWLQLTCNSQLTWIMYENWRGIIKRDGVIAFYCQHSTNKETPNQLINQSINLHYNSNAIL